MKLVGGIDIETTGLEQSEGHRIVEVAVCLYDFDTREPKGSFVQRINPQRSISTAAQAVHGISFEELVSEPVWEDVAPKLVKILKALYLGVAHNGLRFDMPFIRGELMRVGLAMPDVPIVDTMVDARWATPMGKFPNLGELCYSLDIPYDPAKAHGAEYDVSVMMAAFFKGYDAGFFQLPETLRLASAA